MPETEAPSQRQAEDTRKLVYLGAAGVLVTILALYARSKSAASTSDTSTGSAPLSESAMLHLSDSQLSLDTIRAQTQGQIDIINATEAAKESGTAQAIAAANEAAMKSNTPSGTYLGSPGYWQGGSAEAGGGYGHIAAPVGATILAPEGGPSSTSYVRPTSDQRINQPYGPTGPPWPIGQGPGTQPGPSGGGGVSYVRRLNEQGNALGVSGRTPEGLPVGSKRNAQVPVRGAS